MANVFMDASIALMFFALSWVWGGTTRKLFLFCSACWMVTAVLDYQTHLLEEEQKRLQEIETPHPAVLIIFDEDHIQDWQHPRRT